MNNAEHLAVSLARTGNAPQIAPIPHSDLWLVAEPLNNKWKLYVCNPFSTSKRLVTSKPVDSDVFSAIWAQLIVNPTVETALKRAAKHYQKSFAKHYKNYLKNNFKQSCLTHTPAS